MNEQKQEQNRIKYYKYNVYMLKKVKGFKKYIIY